jgi:abortive infection bacteriophage resistance protein
VGFFMHKTPKQGQAFNKPACTPEQHIKLMAERGLSVPDEARAEHYLRYISYYRLSGYALSIQKNNNADGNHTFLGPVDKCTHP